MVEAHFAMHWKRLLFRDYLIAHAEVAADYATLKRELAARAPHDRVAYTQGKNRFIKHYTERAKRWSRALR